MYIRKQTGGEWEGEVATEDWGCCRTFVKSGAMRWVQAVFWQSQGQLSHV